LGTDLIWAIEFDMAVTEHDWNPL